MFSVVVSSKDDAVLKTVLLPSLEPVRKHLRDNGFPDLDIVVVHGETSLCRNYNEGMRRCKWKMKFFIHEDVDIQDTQYPLFVRINALIGANPNIGLVGLVGTTENPPGFWWSCSRPSIYGHVLCGVNDEYWKWNVDSENVPISVVDGMFLATQTAIPFSEDIVGFHFYDSDYSNIIRKAGFDIRVVTHLVKHKASSKDLSGISCDYYNMKWKR